MTNKTIYFIGADGGGTKTKFILTNAEGVILASTTSGPSNIMKSIDMAWQSIQSGINNLLKSANIEHDNTDIKICLGLAGAEYEEIKTTFLAKSYEYIPFTKPENIIIESDAHIACIGIHKGKTGAIVIVGTGTQGYKIQNNNITKLACWGAPVDDQGGGAWMGLNAIRLTFKALDGRIKHSILTKLIFEKFSNNFQDFLIWANKSSTGGYATLTKEIIQAAKQNDSMAIDILKSAANEITLIVNTLHNKNNKNNNPIPLSIVGGMAPFIIPYLHNDITQNLVVRSDPNDVCLGAIILLQNKYK